MGCSSASAATNSSVVALGAEALNFTSNGAVNGWTSSTTCPSTLQAALQHGLPAGSTVTAEDPLNVFGPRIAPQLTEHDVATCAFTIVTNGHTLTQLYFFGMDFTFAAAIRSDLQTDGFTGGSITQVTDGTRQIYTGNGGAVTISQITNDG